MKQDTNPWAKRPVPTTPHPSRQSRKTVTRMGNGVTAKHVAKLAQLVSNMKGGTR